MFDLIKWTNLYANCNVYRVRAELCLSASFSTQNYIILSEGWAIGYCNDVCFENIMALLGVDFLRVYYRFISKIMLTLLSRIREQS